MRHLPISCRILLATAFLLPALAQAQSAPAITHVNSASGYGAYAGVAAPSSWIEIYGSNLAGTTRQWASTDFNGTAAPTVIDGVTVSVGGAPAVISYVSPTQINAQVPNVGAGATAPVVVTYQGRSSAPSQLQIAAQEPGLLAPPGFLVNGTQYVVAIHAATGAYVSSGNIPGTSNSPATPGETLTLYGIGFGAVSPPVAAGTVAGSAAPLVSPFTVTIGNSPATVQYAGIAPSFVGLYQFNVVVPANLSTGDQTIQYALNGVNGAQTLSLSVTGGSTSGTAPGPPKNLSATPGNGSISISFTPAPPPPPSGGATITGYTAVCTAGNQSVSATASTTPVVVTGLTNGTTYSCTVATVSSVGTGKASPPVTAVPGTSGGTGGTGGTGTTGSSFTLTSSAATSGGVLPALYTCDGAGSTLPLSWSNPPAGTQAYAVLMAAAGSPASYNWVLYNIPGSTTSLSQDAFLVGTTLQGDAGPGNVYDPPCSTAAGPTQYSITVYALSAAPSVTVASGASAGAALASAIAPITLGQASLSLTYSRQASTATGGCLASSYGPCAPLPTICGYIRTSLLAANDVGTQPASVSCDGTYAYIGSIDTVTDPMQNGITATNLQVPTPQNFQGSFAWKVPMNPVLCNSTNGGLYAGGNSVENGCTCPGAGAALCSVGGNAGSFYYTPVASGPIGVAVNGIPIFNPCVQTGCSAANASTTDTKTLGQLDICNGHSGRSDDYHYHAAPNCLMAAQSQSYWNSHPVGWMLDGYAIFGYNYADGSPVSRDLCGGSAVSGSKAAAGYPFSYAYYVQDTFPYITNNCMTGVPSPDLYFATCGPGQPGCVNKYSPMRVPPVTAFVVSNMTWNVASDGYSVMQFTFKPTTTPPQSTFTTTEDDSYIVVPPGPDPYTKTVVTSASGSSGSTTLTLTNSAQSLNIGYGMPVSGPGIPANTMVQSANGTTVTLSQATNAAVAAGTQITFTGAASNGCTPENCYTYQPGTYQIRYIQMTGSALQAQLALAPNKGKSACWNFEFQDTTGNTTQPNIAYCR